MEDKHEKKEKSTDKIIIGLLVILAIITIVNQFQINRVNTASELIRLTSVNAGQNAAAQNNAATASATGASTGTSTSTINAGGVDVIPKGIPDIYGEELGVSFDDVTPDDPAKADETIRKLAVLDQQLELSGEKLDRYITIGSSISCEYCCGAKAIIFSNGQAACGCAHSYAMRGLAKYLLDKHADEYTDDQILEEMGKWKVLFFPDVHQQKAAVLKSKGVELNYVNLASNKYRGVEKGASGGSMVGGC